MPDTPNTLKAQFDAAAEAVKQLKKRPSDVTLLQLYGLYKQATQGNVTGERPGMMDFVERSKYDAWARLRGKTQEVAMQDYIKLVEKLRAGG